MQEGEGELMGPYAEFGIIDEFDKQKDYGQTYEPQKYHCIAIEDEYINEWWEQLTHIKTYFHSYNRPSTALARWGITLIPPESLEGFYSIVANDKRAEKSSELRALMKLLLEARDRGNFVIHYGV